MQSLALPRPTSFPSAPIGHPPEPEDGLLKFRAKFSPNRLEQQGYPSPPMSEPHSPTRRPAHTSEPSRHSYHTQVAPSHRLEEGLSLPPPASALFDHRSAPATQSNQQRQVYPGELQPRSHYQTGRTIDHSPYGNPQVPQTYAYGYPAGGIPSYAAGHHAGPMVQQAAIIAPPPARPTKPARRTKAHVASACVNCKKAHLSCDVQRPCNRCVSSGKQDSCKDVQHKKRGRPRLRDDRDFSRSEDGRQQPSQILGAVPASVAEAYPRSFPTVHSQRPSDATRFSGRQGEEHSPSIHSQSALVSNGSQSEGFGSVAISPYPAGPNLVYQALPVAFLNLDLVIQKSNRAFQDLVSFLGDVRGKHLGDILEARQNESLQRLRNELRDERDEREPTYMAPITPIGQDPMRPVMEQLEDRDVDQVSQGFTDRPMYLSFRMSNGQYQSLLVQVRLAKTSLYLVTLVVRSPPRMSGPPLLTQQYAPPTPSQTSQTMSAPTTAGVRDFTPHQTRPPSSTNSTPNSPYFNFSSVRTSLPTFSPSSYGSSSSYGYSPTTGAESGYFPTIQPPTQLGPAYPSPYVAPPRKPSATSEPLREVNRPSRLEGLHLPPIRTGPAPLGSPLHLEGQSATERERELVRRDMPSPNANELRPETPGSSKRRRLNIHEVLE
ncbi:hypothetical protein CC86DRAFT_389537 [Ophiobolus disseminans]|uniref:Zn(2)-C6 fungal-type domain-containing protein n=1 Tax=Ophiobolus disseminans TaxID=1469910 RepID=A0A6A7AKK8_9PLEO|nr:hypothetical protein CC86DRAFT_389537 [Ophiobolus disseminans]